MMTLAWRQSGEDMKMKGCKMVSFMGCYGVLWDLMGFYGILWDFMGFNGI